MMATKRQAHIGVAKRVLAVTRLKENLTHHNVATCAGSSVDKLAEASAYKMPHVPQ